MSQLGQFVFVRGITAPITSRIGVTLRVCSNWCLLCVTQILRGGACPDAGGVLKIFLAAGKKSNKVLTKMLE